MLSYYFRILLAVWMAVVASGQVFGQLLIGQDIADNYVTWLNGSNQGTGFGPWILSTTGPGSAGFFTASSASDGFGNIDSPTKAFGMFGNQPGGIFANAVRNVSEWEHGYGFSVDLAIALQNGNKGIDIRASGADVVFTFNVENDQYKVQGVDLVWPYIQTSIFQLFVFQIGEHLQINLSRGSDNYQVIIPNKTFEGFNAFVGNTVNGNPLNNLYLNNLKVEKYSSILLDDFNRGNSDILGIPSSVIPGTWTETDNLSGGPSNTGYIRLAGNSLELRNCATATGDGGSKAAAFNVGGLYATIFEEADETLEWYFNFRQNRADIGGFGSTNYGMAFVIGANEANFGSTTVDGYAVVLGETGSPDPIRLIHFTNGLPASPVANTIASVSPLTVDRDQYYSVRVTFNPCTNQWGLKVLEDGASGFLNPIRLTGSSDHTGIDVTHIGTDLNFLGGYYTHNNACTNTATFDNIYIPIVPAVITNYTWVGGNGDWQVAGNWTPERFCTKQNDRIVFNGAGSVTITNLPSETIGQLLVIGSSNVIFKDISGGGSASRLRIKGETGDDFVVEMGSTLSLDVAASNNASDFIEIELLQAATGLIAGEFNFQNSNTNSGRNHRLLSNQAGAIQVYGIISAIDLDGNPFGSSTASLSNVVFKSGSVYNHFDGGNPFAVSATQSKVIFETGSLYRWLNDDTSLLARPSFSGRTYANFEMDVNTIENIETGANPFSIDNLTVLQGELIFESEFSGEIRGNIQISLASSLVYNPSVPAQLSLNGVSIQTVSGLGLFSIGSNGTISLENLTRVVVEKDIVVDGVAIVQPNSTIDMREENRLSGSGSFQLLDNAKIYIGSMGGIAASGPTGNIQTASRSFSVQSDYVYNGVMDQITGTGLPPVISGNGSLEIDNPSNTVSLTNDGTTTPILTLSNGLFAVGAGNLFNIASGGSITSSNSADFAVGNLAGKVNFLGTGIINASSTLDFWDVELVAGSGGVNFGNSGTPSINNEFIISQGRFCDTNGPFYKDGSTLVYNTGSSFVAGTEWYATFGSGRGVPFNVQVGKLGVNGSQVDFGSSNAFRALRNSLSIGDASGGSGFAMTLGSQSGGDLRIGGDFTLQSSGSFNPNDRAVFFTGAANQTIRSESMMPLNEVSFDYMIVNKSGGDLLLSEIPGTTVRLNGSIGGNVLVLDGGDIDLQGQNFFLGGSGPFLRVNGGLRNIKSISPANFNVVGEKEVVASASGELEFSDGVTVNISAGMNFGFGGVTTINATLQINAGGFADINAPRYGANGVLKYNTGTTYLRRVEWRGVEGDPGFPNDVVISGGTELIAGGDAGENVATPFRVRRNVTVEENSSLTMNGASTNMTIPLIVGNDLTVDGALTSSDMDGGDIHVAGDWVRGASGTFDPSERMTKFNGSTPQSINSATGTETFYDIQFENAGTKSLQSTDLTILNDLIISTGSAAFAPNSNDIDLKGNWVNNAGESAFSESGTVRFSGDGPQSVTANAGETFAGLDIDNSSKLTEGILLNDPIRISGFLNMSEGLIHSNGEPVTLTSSGNSNGGAYRSYVTGVVAKEVSNSGLLVRFPVGFFLLNGPGDTTSVWQEAGLIPEPSGTSTFSVQYFHENAVPGTNFPSNPPNISLPLERVSTCNHWIINRTGSLNAKVRLHWNDSTTCFDISNIVSLNVARLNSSTIWESQGNSLSNSTLPFTEGWVESNLISAFSPFAIGSFGNLNVLPIELLSFTARPIDSAVETNWITSSEIDNDFFTLERSDDAHNFEAIGRVEGAGYSTQNIHYQFIDDAPYPGISYYRLKQTDFDGTYTYSDIRAVEMPLKGNFDLLKVYRDQDELRLVFDSPASFHMVEIFDMVGQRVYSGSVSGIGSATISNLNAARGMYLLRLSNGAASDTEKFFY